MRAPTIDLGAILSLTNRARPMKAGDGVYGVFRWEDAAPMIRMHLQRHGDRDPLAPYRGDGKLSILASFVRSVLRKMQPSARNAMAKSLSPGVFFVAAFLHKPLLRRICGAMCALGDTFTAKELEEEAKRACVFATSPRETVKRTMLFLEECKAVEKIGKRRYARRRILLSPEEWDAVYQMTKYADGEVRDALFDVWL